MMAPAARRDLASEMRSAGISYAVLRRVENGDAAARQKLLEALRRLGIDVDVTADSSTELLFDMAAVGLEVDDADAGNLTALDAGTPDCWAGIDPGLSGAIAFLRQSGAEVHDMPRLKVSANRWEIDLPRVRDLLEQTKPDFVTIEQQIVLPKQGVASSGKTMFGFGALLGVLTTLRLRFEIVRPQDWKRAAGIPRSSEKGASLLAAERLFPEIDLRGPNGGVRDGRAEALLIAQSGLVRRAVILSKEVSTT